MSETPKSTVAIGFLKDVYPVGPWCLAAIPREGGAPVVKTFGPQSEVECQAWIDERNGRVNLYWHVNPVMKLLTSKATREDIKEVAFLHVDVDPGAGDLKAQQEDIFLGFLPKGNGGKLPPDIPKPTAVIFSGGGYQAFWKLETPLPINGDLARAEDAKLYNMELERRFSADNCHNVDRLMRLPGTMNLPKEEKRKKGRTDQLAKVMWCEPERVYPVDAFKRAAPKGEALGKPGTGTGKLPAVNVDTSNVVRIRELHELDKWQVPDRVKVMMVQGHHPDPDEIEAKRAKHGKPPSRSEWLYDVCCNLARARVPDEVIYGIITDPDWGISDSVVGLESGAHRYAIRQIAKAKGVAANDNPAPIKCDEKGQPYRTPANLRAMIAHLGIRLSMDVFTRKYRLEGLPGFEDELDKAMVRIRTMIAERWLWYPPKELTLEQALDVAYENRFHPLKDYFEGLEWDGTPRLERWLIECAKAKDTPFVRAVSKLHLVAAVRRIYEPGAKYDEMLVLESDQGFNKSTAIRALCPWPELFLDDLPMNLKAKEVMEQAEGKWLVECAELNGMRRSEIEHVKQHLSRAVDKARMAYAHFPSEIKRQWVAFGSTNNKEYLKDRTGNRRFYPVAVDRFDVEALATMRDQLWAEAFHCHRQGMSIRLPSTLWAEAGMEQAARMEENTLAPIILSRLGERTGKLTVDTACTFAGINPHQPDMLNRLKDAMATLGWTYCRQLRMAGLGRVPVFWKGNAVERLTELSVRKRPDGMLVVDATPPCVSAVGKARAEMGLPFEDTNQDPPGHPHRQFDEPVSGEPDGEPVGETD